MLCRTRKEINKYNRNVQGLWKTKPPQRECTTACGRNLQIERALHRTLQSSNRGGRADTTVSSNPSGSHHPANTRRRTRYEQHQAPQHRTTQTVNEELRERILPYAAALVFSGVCTQLAQIEHALPCQTQPYPAAQAEPTAQRVANNVRGNSSTQQRVHAIRRGKRRRSRASQCSIVHLKHQAAREQTPPYSATRLNHATACERN